MGTHLRVALGGWFFAEDVDVEALEPRVIDMEDGMIDGGVSGIVDVCVGIMMVVEDGNEVDGDEGDEMDGESGGAMEVGEVNGEATSLRLSLRVCYGSEMCVEC